MTDTAQLFVKKSLSLVEGEYLPKIEQCLARLTDEDVWWRPAETSNAIGNLLLHLRGNVTQWIIGGVGGREYERQRQKEFDDRELTPRYELFEELKSVVAEAAGIIAAQTPHSLLERRSIQGYDGTVLEAIYHVVEHFAMHTGQIITLTKMRTGQDLKLWRPPTP